MAASPYTIRCSNLSRILACPGSLQLEACFPEMEETEAAKEGTAAHECFAFQYEGVPYAVGDTAPNGVVITTEMQEAAVEFVDLVLGWGAPYVYIEQQYPCPSIHQQCGGTPDAWGWNPATNTIHLADLKFGHRDVEVLDNAQLCGYTLAIADAMQIDGNMEQFIRVEWTIYQPRAYRSGGPVKRYAFYLTDLRALANQIRMAVTEALSASPRCQPGPECRDCVGRHACVALQNAANSVADFVGNTLEEFTLTAAQCGNELKRLLEARNLLNARIEGLSEQALFALQRGERVNGFELKQKYGREVWRSDKKEQARSMAALLDIDINKAPDLITPNQARKLGLDVNGLELSFRPTGGMELSPINTAQTTKIFGSK